MNSENVEVKRQELLKLLLEILQLPGSQEKVNKFIQVYNKYSLFCYQHNLENYDYELTSKSDSLFIVESSPIIYEIKENEKNQALENLYSVLKNVGIGKKDGISENEAKIIIESVVQNARDILSKKMDNFQNSSLTGFCGYAQALTVFPLQEVGLETTVNNVSNLPDCKYRHAFATCIIPIKENGKCYKKQYLIDITYRQFFKAINCNEGRFYESDERFKNHIGPTAGYYVCQTKEGISFASELLKKGYIELNEQNARIYGYGFSCESINLSTTKREIKKISNHSGKEYIKTINNKKLHEELDFERNEIETSLLKKETKTI